MIEWLSLSKLIPGGVSASKSIYDRIFGRTPRMNFDADSGGIELHVFNTRDETIIIEGIEANPSLLGFAAGDEAIDIVRAVVAQRGHGYERPLAVVSPGDSVEIKLITFDPFENSAADVIIKVTMHWRTAERRRFSRSSVVRKISIHDIRDLKTAVESKQPRMFVV
jgi:hypothetical protein